MQKNLGISHDTAIIVISVAILGLLNTVLAGSVMLTVTFNKVFDAIFNWISAHWAVVFIGGLLYVPLASLTVALVIIYRNEIYSYLY